MFEPSPDSVTGTLIGYDERSLRLEGTQWYDALSQTQPVWSRKGDFVDSFVRSRQLADTPALGVVWKNAIATAEAQHVAQTIDVQAWNRALGKRDAVRWRFLAWSALGWGAVMLLALLVSHRRRPVNVVLRPHSVELDGQVLPTRDIENCQLQGGYLVLRMRDGSTVYSRSLPSTPLDEQLELRDAIRRQLLSPMESEQERWAEHEVREQADCLKLNRAASEGAWSGGTSSLSGSRSTQPNRRREFARESRASRSR